MEVDVNDVIKSLSEEISKKSVDLAMSKAQIVKLQEELQEAHKELGIALSQLGKPYNEDDIEGIIVHSEDPDNHVRA